MIALDVDDDGSVERGVATVLARAGRIDALVNNAGWATMGAVEDTAIAEAKAQFETNFFGVLRLCRAVPPAMQRQGWRVHRQHELAFRSLRHALQRALQCSKFAVEGMSDTLRFETRTLGIRGSQAFLRV